MAFRVEISKQAERDAEDVLNWLLTEHAGTPGINWFLALDDAFASLAGFPERCMIAPENARFPFEVRQLLFCKLLILLDVVRGFDSRRHCLLPSTTESRWLFPPFAADRVLNMCKMMPSVPGIGTNGFCHISNAGFGVNELPGKVLLGQGTQERHPTSMKRL